MKHCNQCGRTLPDNALFCDRCGAPVTAAPPSPEEEYQEECRCLSGLRKNLRGEYLSWYITSWVLLGLLVLFLGLFIFLFSSVFPADPDLYFEWFGDPVTANDVTSVLSIVLGVYGLAIFIAFVPVIVMGFVMASRSKRYMNTIYDYPEEAIERCGHAGIIVLGAFFNSIALIFIIINFVHTKSRRAVFDRILSKRQMN